MRNLLFTSAGDHFKCLEQSFNSWNSHEETNFDIFVVFWGDNEEVYKNLQNKVKYLYKSKGGKFQNLVKIYKEYKDVLEQYENIFVIDDDIEINTLEINFMFKLINYYGFDIIQPSLRNVKCCRIDHWIVRQNEETFARKINYIETNMPLFKTKYLLIFLEYLIKLDEPILSGFGIDAMFLHFYKHILKENSKIFGIIDAIGVINPKNIIRSIDILQPLKLRMEEFEKLKKKYNIITERNKEFEYAYECPEELKNEYEKIKEYKNLEEYEKDKYRIVKTADWSKLRLNEKIKYYGTKLTKDFSYFVDKLFAKEYVLKTIKNKNLDCKVAKLIKTIDINNLENEISDIPEPFMIKTSHGSGWNILITDKIKNIEKIKSRLLSYNKKYEVEGEEQYKYLEPKFYIEEIIDDKKLGKNGNALVYMIRYIHNKPYTISVKYYNKQNSYNLNWEPIMPINIGYIDKPKKLDEMIKVGKELSYLFEFLRIDFHIDKNDELYFSEFTFTPNRGEQVFTDEMEDYQSSHWV